MDLSVWKSFVRDFLIQTAPNTIIKSFFVSELVRASEPGKVIFSEDISNVYKYHQVGY